ncbi:MAG TPA: NUDIX hydrolase [Anaerolineales bacterium]|nr:NUDIX hydrolase [Anaerolineales bacterium]
MNQIRALAICVFCKNDRILVAEGYDPIKGETFYRPLGGGIEFGEHSEETIRRELMEEIGADVAQDSLRYLGTVENIFTFNGIAGHEIVMIYDGALKESRLYDQALIVGREANGEEIHAMWKKLDDFRAGKSILYPEGLIELLSE